MDSPAERSHALVDVERVLFAWLWLGEQNDNHVLGGHTQITQPVLTVLLDLLQHKRLMLLPVKLLPSWHILRPISPVEDKNGDCGLVVAERAVEVALQVAELVGGDAAWLASLGLAGTRAWQVIGLDTDGGWRVVCGHVALLGDDVPHSVVYNLRQSSVCRFF